MSAVMEFGHGRVSSILPRFRMLGLCVFRVPFSISARREPNRVRNWEILGVLCLTLSSKSDRVRPANVWSDPLLSGPASDAEAATGGAGMYGAPEAPHTLDALGWTLYPLFSVSVHEHAWMAAGYGVLGMETYFSWSAFGRV